MRKTGSQRTAGGSTTTLSNLLDARGSASAPWLRGPLLTRSSQDADVESCRCAMLDRGVQYRDRAGRRADGHTRLSWQPVVTACHDLTWPNGGSILNIAGRHRRVRMRCRTMAGALDSIDDKLRDRPQKNPRHGLPFGERSTGGGPAHSSGASHLGLRLGRPTTALYRWGFKAGARRRRPRRATNSYRAIPTCASRVSCPDASVRKLVPDHADFRELFGVI